MRNSPLRAFSSPMKDVDTKLADKVYTKAKVDESLKKKVLHTEEKSWGTTNTSTGTTNAGVNNAMIDTNA